MKRRHGMSLRRVFASALLGAVAAAATLGDSPGWAKGDKKDASAHYERYRHLDDFFDASGAAQLPDGRILVVQDDRTIPFAVLRPEGGRYVAETWTREILSERSAGTFNLLADLEEVVLSPDGFLYALGSHSKEAAENFVRFRLDGDRVVEPRVVTSLKPALAALHPALATAAATEVKDTGFNIEGFSFDASGKRALFGFRSPLVDNKAVVVTLDNPAALFNDKAAPQASELTLLDLDGDGIRGMAWLPKIGGYLIAGRMDSPAGKGDFRLWFWSGDPKAKPRAVSVDGLKSLRRPEAIAQVVINGEERILLVSDEGSKSDGKTSQIALIAYDRLRIAP
jgi:Protein of unknown function (DUF3616)